MITTNGVQTVCVVVSKKDGRCQAVFDNDAAAFVYCRKNPGFYFVYRQVRHTSLEVRDVEVPQKGLNH